MTELADAPAATAHDLDVVTHLADTLVDLMRSFVRNRQAIMQAAEHDVEWSSQIVLRCLKTNGPMRAGAIAECLEADPSTISRQVASMVKDGLVERQADPDDGRASILVLTDQAGVVLAEFARLRAQLFADMLVDWSADDVSRLAGLLDRFNTSYRSMTADSLIKNAGQAAANTRSTRSTH